MESGSNSGHGSPSSGDAVGEEDDGDGDDCPLSAWDMLYGVDALECSFVTQGPTDLGILSHRAFVGVLAVYQCGHVCLGVQFKLRVSLHLVDSATTHSDLLIRARKMGVEVKVIHNASVMNAVGICGLQLYRFGEAVSIPFFTETWRPDSFYDKIKANKLLGLHTLCLLDIRVKEPSIESLCRGKKVYEPPKFMTINTAIEQLLVIEESRAESVYNLDTTCVGLVCLGSEAQRIVVGSMKELRTIDFGPPLHCLIIVGNTHPIEDEMLEFYAMPKTCFNTQSRTD